MLPQGANRVTYEIGGESILPVQQPHRSHSSNVQAASRVQPVPPEHEIGAIAGWLVDGFGHVEDDPGPERLATQPECPLDLIIFRGKGRTEKCTTLMVRVSRHRPRWSGSLLMV